MHLPKRNFKFRIFKALNRIFLPFYLNWLWPINIPSSGLNKRFAMTLKMEAMVLCVLKAIAIAVCDSHQFCRNGLLQASEVNRISQQPATDCTATC
jgi:hypothetical protein